MAVEIRPKTGSLAVKVERNDHNTLTHRNDPNQHSIEAITGLSEALINLNELVSDIKGNVNSNNNSAKESIEGLVNSIELLATNLTELINNLVNSERERSEVQEKALKEQIGFLDEDVIAVGNELSAHINYTQSLENDLNVKLKNEAARATEEEKVLYNEIKQECTRAQIEEEKLHKLITAETYLAREQEALLLDTINIKYDQSKMDNNQIIKSFDNEIKKAHKKTEILSNDLLVEVNRATSAEENLALRIEELANRTSEDKKSLQESIDAIDTDFINNLETSLLTKADLIEGKVPIEQLPENHVSKSIIET